MGDMDFVITLIADADKIRLPEAFADSMAQVLSMQDITVNKTTWLKEGVAVDLFVQHSAADTLDSIVQEAIRGYHFDAIVQPVAHRRKKLLVADMESTMVDVECLDELAKYVGLEKKISAITERAMNGEIDFTQAITERVGLLKGLPESALQEVMDKKVKPMPGAETLMQAMKKNGVYTLLVTGGFDFFAARVKDMLGFDAYRANKLEMTLPPQAGGDGGGRQQSLPPLTPPASGRGIKILTGKIVPPILGKEAKLTAMLEICQKREITPEEVLAIGDGANDLPMLLAAGLGVAYHAKPTVRAQAKARINHCDFSSLVFGLGLS